MTPNVRLTGRGFGVKILASSAVMLMAAVFAREVSSDLLQFAARDPGVRPGPAGAGGLLPGLTPFEQQLFTATREVFQEVQSVQGTVADTEAGLGPRFNLDSCAGCHIQPDI